MEASTRTRSGRISKPPDRYEPIEQVEDDYAPEDYDDDESEVSSAVSYSDEELEEEDEDDDDSFIESDGSDKSEDEEEYSTHGRRSATTPVPVKKRGVPAAAGARRPRGQSASPRQPNGFPANVLQPAPSA